jgi:hypothetical protein
VRLQWPHQEQPPRRLKQLQVPLALQLQHVLLKKKQIRAPPSGVMRSLLSSTETILDLERFKS